MTIAVGAKLPEATFMVMRDGKGTQVTTADVFGGKKVALFAVPGAFTPTCHLKHLPGFLNHLADFKAQGVDTVACTSVNDHHVMGAWAKASGTEGKIELLADGTGAFAVAMGLDAVLGPMGVRSKRYAALVDNGVLKILHVEDNPGVAEASSAEALLKAMGA
jgi:glutaredoxin/glutathione-dependent peroxiredoxin